MDRRARIIAVGNQKGGVGKTTVAVHLAAGLGELGRRCLVVDLDMNRGATRHLGITTDRFLGSFEMITGQEDPLEVIVTEQDEVVLPENVHLIAARRNLEKVEQVLLSHNKFLILQDVLVEPLGKLRAHYDYIFLDTAPNATAPTVAAYKAADFFILAVTPDPLALAGLNDALTDIRDAQRHGNPALRLLGVVLSGVDGRRTRLASQLIEAIENQFTLDGQTAKFETTISRSTVVPEAQKHGRTVFQTVPRHKACQQYRALATEFESRIIALDSAGTSEFPSRAQLEGPTPHGQARTS